MNMFGGGGGGKKFKMPKQKGLGQQYGKGVNLNIRFLRRQLNAERRFRQTEDAQRIGHQQQLQDQFGPRQAQQQLTALNTLAPGYSDRYAQAGRLASESANTPSAFESRALSDLQSGYHLPPELLQEVTNTIRGRQAASGNTEGPGSIAGEAAFTGSAMNQMYQQRMQNAQQAEGVHQARLGNLASFLNGSNPIQQIQGISPVSPDRSFAYVNPNAGYLGLQAGQQQYANQLGAAGIQSSGSSGGGFPWGQLLSTAGTVAAAFSDDRLKTDRHKVGKTPSGLDIYKYMIRGTGRRFIGAMASDVEKKRPDAVSEDPSGYKMVDYSKIDVPFVRTA